MGVENGHQTNGMTSSKVDLEAALFFIMHARDGKLCGEALCDVQKEAYVGLHDCSCY
jgi:hypothetical protein